MIKLVSVLRRRAGLDAESFQRYWRETHAPLVAALPGLRRYVQSHTLLSGYRKREPAADGIAELWFENTDALRALEGSPALAAVRRDESEFVDPAGHQQVFTEDHVIKDGPIPDDGVKNIEFVRRKAGMPVEAFHRYWIETHGPLGAAIETVLRYVQSHARRTAYRDGREPAYDGFALTWFASTEAMRASARSPEYAVTRADEENFVSEPLDFIITREHVIVP